MKKKQAVEIEKAEHPGPAILGRARPDLRAPNSLDIAFSEGATSAKERILG